MVYTSASCHLNTVLTVAFILYLYISCLSFFTGSRLKRKWFIRIKDMFLFEDMQDMILYTERVRVVGVRGGDIGNDNGHGRNYLLDNSVVDMVLNKRTLVRGYSFF